MFGPVNCCVTWTRCKGISPQSFATLLANCAELRLNCDTAARSANCEPAIFERDDPVGHVAQQTAMRNGDHGGLAGQSPQRRRNRLLAVGIERLLASSRCGEGSPLHLRRAAIIDGAAALSGVPDGRRLPGAAGRSGNIADRAEAHQFGLGPGRLGRILLFHRRSTFRLRTYHGPVPSQKLRDYLAGPTKAAALNSSTKAAMSAASVAASTSKAAARCSAICASSR